MIILEFFDKIFTPFMPAVAKYGIVFRIVVSIIIAISIMFFVLGEIKQTQIVEKVKLNIDERNRAITTKKYKRRYVRDYWDNPVSRFLDDTYKYSRIYKHNVRFKTSVGYFCYSFAISFVLGLICFVIFRKYKFFFIGLLAGMLILYGIIFVQRIIYKKNVSGDLIQFLNLLGNYSATTTELSNIFLQIAPKMHSPLKECLLECVAEAQSNNVQKEPYYNLIHKIESTKFEEVITELVETAEYTNSYAIVVSQNRKAIQDFSKGAKERKNQAIENTITVLIAEAGMIGAIYMFEVFVPGIVHNIFYTALGNIFLSIVIGCTIYFIGSILTNIE